MIERAANPDSLEGVLAAAIDTWHETHPDLTVPDILRVLESMRHKFTEGMIFTGNEKPGQR